MEKALCVFSPVRGRLWPPWTEQVPCLGALLAFCVNQGILASILSSLIHSFANAISPSGSPGSCGGWTPAGHFNTTLTPMDRSTKQKNNKETQSLNDTIDQLDLIDTYRTFHPKTMNFTFLSSAHGAFSRIDHILGHKSCLGKSKKKLKLFQAFFLTTMQ